MCSPSGTLTSVSAPPGEGGNREAATELAKTKRRKLSPLAQLQDVAQAFDVGPPVFRILVPGKIVVGR